MHISLGYPIELFGVKYDIYSIGISKKVRKTDYLQHNHSHAEFHYISEGACELTADDGSYVLRKGSAVLIPSGVYHRFTTLSEDAERFELSFKSRTGKQGENAVYFKDDKCIMLSSEQLLSLTDSITYIKDILIKEGSTPSKLSLEKIRAMSTVFIAELYSALYEIPVKSSEKVNSMVVKRQSEIDSFFSHHFTHDEYCAELSGKLNVSNRQLTRIIKQTYGLNYREKLNEVKLKNAYDLLYNTNMSIKEIAKFLGYCDTANFTAFFKKQTGTTPLKARTEYKLKK